MRISTPIAYIKKMNNTDIEFFVPEDCDYTELPLGHREDPDILVYFNNDVSVLVENPNSLINKRKAMYCDKTFEELVY